MSAKPEIQFMIVTHDRLPNEPDSWNHIQLFVSDNNFRSCRKVTMYSDLFYCKELEELQKRLECRTITQEEFNKQFWKDNWSTKIYGDYKKRSLLSKKLLTAIFECNRCRDRHCYHDCRIYEYLNSRDV